MNFIIQKVNALVTVAALVPTSLSLAADADNQAKMKVITQISIDAVSELIFPDAPQGDGAGQVAPGTTDNANNASFTVAGEPGKAYNILLPADGAVAMALNGTGTAPDEVIAVGDFASFPSGSGQIQSNGEQLLLVGATRSALSSSQVPGDYVGTFTVIVAYQ
jgi:hypothetical protein